METNVVSRFKLAFHFIINAVSRNPLFYISAVQKFRSELSQGGEFITVKRERVYCGGQIKILCGGVSSVGLFKDFGNFNVESQRPTKVDLIRLTEP